MFKPLLSPIDSPNSNPRFFDSLSYPLLGAPKLDGIRGVVKNSAVLSRSGKILPSFQVQDLFSKYAHFDGELIEGDCKDPNVYNRTQSFVMSADKVGNLGFYVFDYTHPDWLHKPFYERLEFISDFLTKESLDDSVAAVPHEPIEDLSELLEYEQQQLALGYEGIMLRSPLSPYKNGRATYKEGIIYKLKRFEDAEGKVVAFECRLHNNNILEKDELGYAKRSEAKAGLVAIGQVGKFIVAFKDMVLEVAPGNFSHSELKEIWDNQDKYLGKFIKFRYFNHGIKDKPRFPRAVGWRDPGDL